MQPPRLRLLCDSNPMCFGSTTALLSVLDALDADSWALSHGITAELLDVDPAVHRVIHANVKAPAEVASALAEVDVDAVLVVSNHSCLDLYLSMGLPLFYVDILYWMGGPKNHSFWQHAESAFAQRFPGIEDVALRATCPPCLVGPLIRRLPGPRRQSEGTLAQLGGGRSKWVIPGSNSHYARFMADCISDLKDLPTPLRICSGSEAIQSIGGNHPIRQRAELSTLPHPAMMDVLSGSSLYITSPGLNAVFEGLYLRKPMLFLPPQNATQVLQLSVYERMGLVSTGINLPDLIDGFPTAFESLSEADLTAAVVAHLPSLAAPTCRRRIIEHIEQQRREWPSRQGARDAFAGYLGVPGGPDVAQAILRWWDRLWM